MNNTQHLRPPQAKAASSLLLLYWGFRLVLFLGHHPPTSYVAAGLLTATWGSLFFCIWLLFRGMSWPRWLFLALFVGNCWVATHFSPPSAMQSISAFVQLLLQLLAMVLLFLPNINRWFRGHAGIA